ncbi:MAG: NAD(P)-dependent oxidoreductase [Gemmatimonadaceae bacterium]|nr:NAD(P)-dependent oxidoreductase [Gemmatimonadaceae bacterium]
MSTESVFVTGATGFVGQRAAIAFREQGMRVTALVRASSDAATVARLADAGVSIAVDAGDVPTLRDQLAASGAPCVVHLATRFVAEHRADEVEPLVHDNIAFGARLLEAMTASEVTAIVHAGTAWQHYENRDYSPVSLYAATKEAFAAIVRYYVEIRGVRAVGCEFTDMYGAGDTRKKVLWAMRNAVATGAALSLSGGEQIVDLLHVTDAIAALRVATTRAMSAAAGTEERWAVRGSEPCTLRELVARFERVRSETVPVAWGARPYRARETFTPWTSGALLPGWAPRVTLDDGLRTL